MLFHFNVIKRSIGLLLLSKVFVLYFLVTVFVTLVHIVIHFQEVKGQIKASLLQTGSMFEESLSKALWNLDDDQIANVLNGVIYRDEVLVALLKDDKDEVIKMFNKDSSDLKLSSDKNEQFSKQEGFFSEVIPVIFTEDGEDNNLGELHLLSHDDVVFARIKTELIVILINSILKTLALWIIFYYISKRYLSRPLAALMGRTQDIQKNRFTIDSIQLPDGETELTKLTKAFNDMSKDLKMYHNEMNEQIDIKTKEYQSKAEEANAAAEAKTRFLAMMSHEIRTPMNGVIGMTEYLQDTQLDDNQKDCLQVIRSSGRTLLTVINDILDYSKMEAGKMDIEIVDFNINELCEDVLKMVRYNANKNETKLELDIADLTNQMRRGDPGRIRQIILNFLSNAIKFSPKGNVKFKLHMVDDSNKFRFIVEDTGIGMSDAQLKKIFQPFQQADSSTTRRFGGTGLGLVICKKLITLMNGEIGVESVEGKGSTFWFELTLPEAQQRSRLKIQDQNVLREIKVLWVEDELSREKDLHNLNNDLVKRLTYANDSVTGLQNFKDKEWDFIFISRNLSDELAFNFIKDIQLLNNKKTNIVLFAKNGILGDGELCRELKVDAYISGKLNLEIIEELILFLIDKSSDTYELTTRFDLDSTGLYDCPESKTNNTLKILVVDDNEINLKVASKLIQKLSHSVFTVNSGEKALEMCQSNEYDLILMDMQMPGMDGMKTTSCLRGSDGPNKDKPVIALTANATDKDRKLCEDSGMNDFLSKPLMLDKLKDTVQKFSK